ncbi:MAG: hypothetical protein QXL10_02570 [Candidatus Bathyarchaeia archaeon]
MGFSVTLASAIVFIGFLVIFASFAAAFFQGIREFYYTAEAYVNREREKIDVKLQLTIEAVNATACIAKVENLGSKTIFLKNQNGFNWNTLVVSYGKGSQRYSYLIEDYEILDVKVSGANITFSPNMHDYLNFGEEMRLSFSIPYGAPEIPSQAIVSVTFASHYGVTASGEAVRE